MQLHASPQDGATTALQGHLPRDSRDGARDVRLRGGDITIEGRKVHERETRVGARVQREGSQVKEFRLCEWLCSDTVRAQP